MTFDCAGGFFGIAAHVTGPGTRRILLDADFWRLGTRSGDNGFISTRGSVIIHELMHLAGAFDYHDLFPVSHVSDFQYALDLAAFLPDYAPYNANNHEYFYLGCLARFPC